MIHTKHDRRVLVTGATGFVGTRLCHQLVHEGYSVRAVVRRPTATRHQSKNRQRSILRLRSSAVDIYQTRLASASEQAEASQFEHAVVPDLTHFAHWSELLQGVDAIVHLVARTHVVDEFGSAAMQEYRRINVQLTKRLALAAAREGVEQFVYLSSIKAVGNGDDFAYSEDTPCRPEDSYGISKLAAEHELAQALRDEHCDYTILRPPLVYGPQVQGNFLRLMQLVDRGFPLPGVGNARSMVHVDNLVSAITKSIATSGSNGRTFHVADPRPISTSQLVRSMAVGLQRPCRVLPVPNFFLHGLGNATGKSEEIKRLAGSLKVTTDRIQRQLNWRPTITTEDGVKATCQAYRKTPWAQKPKPAATATPASDTHKSTRAAA